MPNQLRECSRCKMPVIVPAIYCHDCRLAVEAEKEKKLSESLSGSYHRSTVTILRESPDILDRVFAYLLDTVILSGLFYVVIWFLSQDKIVGFYLRNEMVLPVWIFLGIFLFYQLSFLVVGGTTVGKWFLGMKVRSNSGEPCTTTQILIRIVTQTVAMGVTGLLILALPSEKMPEQLGLYPYNLVFIPYLLFYGFILVAGDRRGIHDRVAGTSVRNVSSPSIVRIVTVFLTIIMIHQLLKGLDFFSW